METISSNQAKKDRREWTVMNLFVEAYSSMPIGELRKSECPDFVLTTQSSAGRRRRLGIELTELKYERADRQFNMRAHEDYLSLIMDDAERLFRARHDVTLCVDVRFADSMSPLILAPDRNPQRGAAGLAPTQADTANEPDALRQALSETIARIVEDNLPEATGKRYRVDRMSKYGDLNLPSYIDSLAICNVSGRLGEPLWYASMHTHVKPLSIESVSQRIADKDSKMRHYDTSCDELWLVIVQNSFLMSAAYNAADGQRALQHRYRSRFDKVFVFERSEARVRQLNILRKLRG